MQDFKIPQGLRVYAIGDIHGFSEALAAIHMEISNDILRRPCESVHIIYLGDYVDRGPDNKRVIDDLIARRDRGDGIQKTFIRGNHDDAFLQFILHEPHRDGPYGGGWLEWGGVQTAASYGLSLTSEDILMPAARERMHDNLRRLVPPSHVNFLHSLSSHIVIGDYYFTHAGVDPAKPLSAQNPKTVMVIREPFLSWPHQLEKKVVHGHTITPEPDIQHHRIGLDTGLWKGGKLTCGVFEGADIRFLQV